MQPTQSHLHQFFAAAQAYDAEKTMKEIYASAFADATNHIQAALQGGVELPAAIRARAVQLNDLADLIEAATKLDDEPGGDKPTTDEAACEQPAPEPESKAQAAVSQGPATAPTAEAPATTEAAAKPKEEPQPAPVGA